MAGLLRYRPGGLVSIFFFIFIFGYANAEEDAGIADWQAYSNAENRFTFSYPKDWEVIDEGFYKTAYSLTIQRIAGSEDANNWIRINSPQFQEEDGKCIEVELQRICTYSQDAEVLDIMERLAAGFKLRQVVEGVTRD